MNIDTKFFNNLPKLIPFISLTFLLGSLWYEGLHYGFFGINIFSYISITEGINLFIDKLPLMVVISVGTLFFFFFFQLVFEKYLARLFHQSKYSKRVRMSRFPWVMLITFSISILPMLGFMVFIPIWLPGSFKTEEFLIIRAFIFLFTIFWFFNLSISFSRAKYDNNYFSQKSLLVTLIITFFVVIYYYHRLEILNIREPRFSWKKIDYVIKMRNNEIISSGDSTYFLGKTKDYIFLLYPNRRDYISKTRVLNMADIKELVISRGIPWYSVFP